ncbi:MAG: hypothetical protein AAF573_06700 [Bacteroidota bacterium]
MKNLIITFVTVCTLFTTNQLFAQPAADNTLASTSTTSATYAEDIAVLENFKANKTQKKVIKKVKRYVSPRVIEKGVRTDALAGKKVTVQLSLNTNGTISNLQIVEGFEETIDARVLALIKEYDAKNPLAASKLDKPTTIQLEIPIVGKKQYMN